MSLPLSTKPRLKNDNNRQLLDRRLYRRVKVKLDGRFMRADKAEYPCVATSISVGFVRVASTVKVAIDEHIVAYFDHIGGVQGTVIEKSDDGFMIQFRATRRKREKLAAELTWLLSRDEISGIEQRRHERHRVVNKVSVLKLDEGIEVQCRILDISLSGASIGTSARPPIGTEIQLGKQRARVMRHHDAGIGVQFLTPQAPEALRQYLG